MASRRNHPPKKAIQFLQFYCKAELLEEIQGDLVEEFMVRTKNMPSIKARLLFWIMVLSFLRPFAIKKFTNPLNSNFMIRHYLKVAFRNFLRHKLAVGINIFSLTLGIGCAILIYLFILNEWTYDQFHEKKEQLYRINRAVYNGQGVMVDGIEGHPLPMAKALKEAYPEISETCRIFDDTDYIKSGQFLSEERQYYVDDNFFELFSFPFLTGNPSSALSSPNQAVLSHSLAKRIFGKNEVIGQTIEVFFNDRYFPFEITGVIEDVPPNSTLEFEIALPISFFESNGLGKRYRDSWNMSFIRTFALIQPGVDIKALEEKTINFCDEHFPRRTAIQEQYGEKSYYGEVFQPIKDIHFDELVETNLGKAGVRRHSMVLGGIGCIILLIACINFTILAIGRSATRTKEIGIRKVIGAFGRQLRTQFLGEALLMSGLSTLLGLGFAQIFLHQFNDLSDRSLSLYALLKPESIGFILICTIVCGLLAGLYPAVLLAKYQPVKSMSSSLKLGKTNFFTKSLVTVQFVLSIVLVIITLVMLEQLRFMKNKDLGFDKELLIVVQRQGQDNEQFVTTYKNELNGMSEVISVMGANPAIAHGGFRSNFDFEGKNIEYFITFIESNYIETMGIDLKAGRNFRPGSAIDSTQHILVNEAFVEALGWEDPIGRPVKGLENAGYTDPIIIGVLNNFHFQSLEHAVTPMWLALSDPSSMDDLVIKTHPSNIQFVIQKSESIWKEQMNSESPFTYSFLDEDIAAMYAEEERWGKIITLSGIIALAIAFLGMYGLIAMSLAGRLKEMSIRKILGANLGKLALTLAGPFARIVIIALLISLPLAWYFSVEWLGNFAFHIPFKPGLVILAFLIIWILFMLATSYHVWRSFKVDPVVFLKTE